MEEDILNFLPPVMFRGTPCRHLLFSHLPNFDPQIKHMREKTKIECVQTIFFS